MRKANSGHLVCMAAILLAVFSCVRAEETVCKVRLIPQKGLDGNIIYPNIYDAVCDGAVIVASPADVKGVADTAQKVEQSIEELKKRIEYLNAALETLSTKYDVLTKRLENLEDRPASNSASKVQR
jgi:hypothetical protein